MKLFQKASAAVLAVCGVLSAVPGAQAAGLQDLPGQELWQPYLNAAPQDADSFVHDPVGALLSLLPASPLEMIRQMAHCYADVLLFLLLLILLSFLVGEAADNALLELAAAVGCGTLLWGDLMTLAQQVCERMTGWKDYLLGFLPVYSGVLTAGGEANAGAAASGLLLTGLCFLAQCTATVVSPLLQSYLAVSMACCISTQRGLSDTCRATGALLQKGLRWAGRLFAVLLGLQRAITVQLDRSALRLGELFTGSVPAGPAQPFLQQCRTGSERYGRGLSDRNGAAEKQSGPCGAHDDRCGVFAAVCAADAPSGVPHSLQPFVRACIEQPLSGAVRLYGRSCKMHGCHHSIVF